MSFSINLNIFDIVLSATLFIYNICKLIQKIKYQHIIFFCMTLSLFTYPSLTTSQIQCHFIKIWSYFRIVNNSAVFLWIWHCTGCREVPKERKVFIPWIHHMEHTKKISGLFKNVFTFMIMSLLLVLFLTRK